MTTVYTNTYNYFQESLASMGQVLTHVSSSMASPATDASEAPHSSLLSELDTQYRILIEKYEALLEAREQQDQQQRQQDQQYQQQNQQYHLKDQQQVADSSRTDKEFLNSSTVKSVEAEGISGPISLVMRGSDCGDTCGDSASLLRCQRCSTCSCGIPASTAHHHQRPKSNMEMEFFSEVETSSSGFSEGGESRSLYFSKYTQTELSAERIYDELATPTAEYSIVTPAGQFLDLKSPVNPCDSRFQSAPEYKKLFQEIFSVLKKTVDENEEKEAVIIEPSSTDAKNEAFQTVSDNCSHNTTDTTINEAATTSVTSSSIDDVEQTESNKKTKQRNKIKSVTSSSESTISVSDATLENSNILKPIRPNSLDLASNCSSRSSSKHRRRRRHQKARTQEIENQQKSDNVNGNCSAKEVVTTNEDVNNCTSQKENNVENIESIDQAKVTTSSILIDSNQRENQNKKSRNLCEKHRLQQQSRKRAKRNRSRNNSKQRHNDGEVLDKDKFSNGTTDQIYASLDLNECSNLASSEFSGASASILPPTSSQQRSHKKRNHDGSSTEHRQEFRKRREHRKIGLDYFDCKDSSGYYSGQEITYYSSKSREKEHNGQFNTSKGIDNCWSGGKDWKVAAYSKPKVSFPSVEVAKLRRLEMTYAEVLKSHLARASQRRH